MSRDWAGTVLTMTPANKVRELLREFAKTLDASASARAVGIPERTARDIIARHEKTAAIRRGHARACERAIRDGRKALREELRGARAYLREHTDPHSKVCGLEPRDYAAMLNAIGSIVDRALAVDASRDRRKMARIGRDKARAEIALLEAKARGDVQEVVVLTQQQAAERARIVFGSPSALEAGTDGPSDTSADVVEGNPLPVPDPLDH